jgi:acetyl-CoA C-acetyltransferase
MKEVYIVAAVRTPIGSFGGTLVGLSATQLGSLAVKAAMSKINLDAKQVQELFFGNVISAGLGKLPLHKWLLVQAWL